MRNIIKTAGAAFFLACVASIPASATPVTLNFSGTVQWVGSPALIPLVSAGAIVSGSVTYESATPDLSPNPGLGDYSGAVTSFSYTINSVVGTGGSGSIGIGNDYTIPFTGYAGDTFQALGGSSFTSVSGAGNMDYQLRFLDHFGSGATAFSNDSLPANADFFGGGSFSGLSDQASLTLFGTTGAFAGLSGESLITPQWNQEIALTAMITSLTSEDTSTVSEPAIILLFGVAAAGLGIANRRARRKKLRA